MPDWGVSIRDSKSLARFAGAHFEGEAERSAFLSALVAPAPRGTAVVVLEGASPPGAVEPEPWQPPFVAVLPPGARPGGDPRHAAGELYALDPSSAWAAGLMLALPTLPQRVLDLCAAPGGKTVFAWRAFRPERLVANEVVGKRHGALRSNLDRCRVTAEVTQMDSAVWAEAEPEGFDLVVVDAPCSGQSLVAKGKDAFGAFLPKMIAMNAARQRRILANALLCVAPGGALLYTTCTFAPEEDEETVEWLLARAPGVQAVGSPLYDPWRSTRSAHPCYRAYPHRGPGAGGFAALFLDGRPPREKAGTFRPLTG